MERVDELIEFLDKGSHPTIDPVVRAVDALGRLGDARAVPSLLALLQRQLDRRDGSFTVPGRWVVALARIGTDEAWEAVRRLAGDVPYKHAYGREAMPRTLAQQCVYEFEHDGAISPYA